MMAGLGVVVDAGGWLVSINNTVGGVGVVVLVHIIVVVVVTGGGASQ